MDTCLKILTVALVGLTVARENAESEIVSEDGYYLDLVDDFLPAASSPGTIIQCPSSNVIRTRYKCRSTSNERADCSRVRCCPGYTLIGGHCVPKGTDPCTLELCEQHCSVLLQRVICTCWDGYRFSPERQRQGLKPVCVDVNECSEGSADCEQLCKNQPGGFSCDCNDGYRLRTDNRTCEKIVDRKKDENDAAAATRCYASCDTVLRMHDKVKKLQEKVAALGTAIRPSSYSTGPFVSMGPVGPPGPSGPRGFSDDNVPSISGAYARDNDRTYSVLDSFVQDNDGYCKCQRGPIGPTGPTGVAGQKGEPGERGPRGQRGAPGSFDFLLLLLADVRHDIVLLQEKVFQGEPPPRFDFQAVLKKHRLAKERSKLQKQQATTTPTSRHGIEDFEGAKPFHYSDYTLEDELAETSGEDLDQYEE